MRIGLTNLVLAAGLALSGQQLAAQPGPAIAGDDGNTPQCRAALTIADQAFRSTHASLVWPIAASDGPEGTIVLARNALDISGGDGLRSDPAVFERIESATGPVRSIVWQRQAVHGSRLAIAVFGRGWRGDNYLLYRLDAAQSRDEFLHALQQPGHADERFTPAADISRWNPPLILKDAQSGELWVIDQGEPYAAMGKWRVLNASRDMTAARCEIDFAPDGKPGLDQLPPAVRRFAALTDQALGPGRDEGTLQPTAAIRLAVGKGWAIASERPWALTENPYNSRMEVEAGLADWARSVPARQTLHRDIRRQYRAAEQALAGYYQSRFSLDAHAAHQISAYVMDQMLRRYFVFHSESPRGGPSQPPWPSTMH